MEIQPGTLCIIKAGKDCGTCVTAIYQAEAKEVFDWIYANQYVRLDDSNFSEPHTFWKLDKPVTWRGTMSSGEPWEGLIPYESHRYLMPIPPLADDEGVTNARELEHSS